MPPSPLSFKVLLPPLTSISPWKGFPWNDATKISFLPEGYIYVCVCVGVYVGVKPPGSTSGGLVEPRQDSSSIQGGVGSIPPSQLSTTAAHHRPCWRGSRESWGGRRPPASLFSERRLVSVVWLEGKMLGLSLRCWPLFVNSDLALPAVGDDVIAHSGGPEAQGSPVAPTKGTARLQAASQQLNVCQADHEVPKV